MPVEVKPLFRPDVLRPRLTAFEIPQKVKDWRELIVKWAQLLTSPQADRLKEQELLPDFLTDVFHVILGYSRPTDNPSRYTLSREKHVQVDGKFADAVLGAQQVVPESGPCHLDELRTASEKSGQELTNEFYVRYANVREDMFEQLCASNPSESRHSVLTATQKVLDRVLFCAFCENRGLLPQNTLGQAFEHRDPYNPRPIWENFRGLFRSIDEGNKPLTISHTHIG